MRRLTPLPRGHADTVGARLRGRLIEKDLSLAALARKIGMDYDYLHKIVADKERLSVQVALKIQPILDLDAFEILRFQLTHEIDKVRRSMRLELT